jgi:hypothetical protein
MNLVISAARLSFGGRGDDVARLQKALTALGRTIPATRSPLERWAQAPARW